MIATFLTLLSGAALKGTILILVVALLQWVGRDRIPPSWRFAMWMLVVVRLLLPMAPATPFSMFNLASARPQLDLVGRPSAVSPAHSLSDSARDLPAGTAQGPAPHSPVPGILLAIWAAGFLALAGRAAFASLRFQRSLTRESARGPAHSLSPAVKELLEASREFMGIRRPVEIRLSELVTSPAVHGIIHPRLLIPREIAQSFLPDDFRYVFLHELAHLRRRDVVLNWMLALAEWLHWYNPLVWIAVARMREERELACDAMALGRLRIDERPRYGQTILKLLDCFRSPAAVPALVGIANQKSQMKRRIIMIAGFKKSRLTGFFAALVLVLGVVSLTDAQTVQRTMMRVAAPSPETAATFQKLDQKVTLKLDNASILEVLNAVSSRTGVTINLSPEVATEVSQLPTLSIDAENIPAHILANESLAALDLALDLKADGAEVTKGNGQRRMIISDDGAPGTEQMSLRRMHAPAADSGSEKIIVENRALADPGDAAATIEWLRGSPSADDAPLPEVITDADDAESDLPAPKAGERVMVRVHRTAPDGAVAGADDSTSHAPHQRILTRFVDKNGEKSTLTIKVNKPASEK